MGLYREIYGTYFAGQTLSAELRNRRDAYFAAMPEICVERAYWLTKYHLDHGLLGKSRISALDKAKAFAYVQANRSAVVWHEKAMRRGSGKNCVVLPLAGESADESPLAGSTTSKFKGVPLFPEFLAETIWPELYGISTRAANPQYLDTVAKHFEGLTDAQLLDRVIFPAWSNDTVMELTRKQEPVGAGPSPTLLEKMLYFAFYTTTKTECITHTIPDLRRVVYDGLGKVIAEARQRSAAAADPEEKDFYDAMSIAMLAVCDYAGRLAAAAAAMAAREPQGSKRRIKLAQIADIYRRIPRQPATNFREGVTAIWVCWTALFQESQNIALSLGRLDQLLDPLLQTDLVRAQSAAARVQVMDDARELLCHLWMKIGDHAPMTPEASEALFGGSGSNQAITIGGVKADPGTNRPVDAVNDATYLILDSIEAMSLRDPNLNARVYPAISSPDYVRRLALANVRTGATPAIHNDRAIIPTLQASLAGQQASAAEAIDYGIVGCIEPVSAGRHFGHTGAVLINLAAVVEWALYQGRHRHTGLTAADPLIGAATPDPRSFSTFADFFDGAVERQIGQLVRDVVALNNALGRTHQKYYPTPLLSALFEGPMDKGCDVTQGGGKFNSSGIAIIGLADAADSLAAIQEVGFGGAAPRVGEILDALRRGFNEPLVGLAAELAKPERRYGRETSAAAGPSPGTQMAARLAQRLADAFGAETNYRGGPYRVGYYSMTSHAAFGLLSGALPSGRPAQAAFASGITPMSDTPTCLPETLRAVASLPAGALANGVALNISFQADHDEAAAADRLVLYLNGYFEAAPGGVEIQFNMMGRDELLDAYQNPANHPELLVRVSGYTAYFKDLNDHMKKEVIRRTEYGPVNGVVISLTPGQDQATKQGS